MYTLDNELDVTVEEALDVFNISQEKFDVLLDEFLGEGVLKPIDCKLLRSQGLAPSSIVKARDLEDFSKLESSVSEYRRDILNMAVMLFSIRANQHHANWMKWLTFAIAGASLLQIGMQFL